MMTINRGAEVEERFVGFILCRGPVFLHVSQEAVLNANEHFLDCFKRGANPQTSVSDNLKTFALVEAVYEAATTGRVVKPKYCNYSYPKDSGVKKRPLQLLVILLSHFLEKVRYFFRDNTRIYPHRTKIETSH